MANYRKLGKNMVSLTIGNFASKLLSFFFVPFYTAVLNTEEYGTADLVATTVSLLFPFFSFIICEAMMRFALNKEENPEQIFAIGMGVWGCGFLLLLLLSPILMLFPALREYWVLVVLYYAAYSVNYNIGYFVRGIERVTEYSIGGIVNTVCTIGLNLLLLLVFRAGVKGYLCSFIIANLVAALYQIISCKIYKYRVKPGEFDRDLLKRMLRYSVPMIPNSASWWISNSSDRYILLYFAGASANGIYSVAYKIPTIITMVTSIFVSAWRLSAVEKFGSEESKKFYSEVLGMYITVTVCMSSGIMIINKPFSDFLYSKDFYQAWQFVPVLIVASIIHSYCDFFGTIYTSALKTRMLFVSTLLGACTNIVLNLLLIPRYAAMGAAVATMISYMAVLLVRMIHSRKIIRLKYDLFRDMGCVVLLGVQTVIASMSLKYEFVYSAVLFVMIVLLRKNSIIFVANRFLKRKKVK